MDGFVSNGIKLVGITLAALSASAATAQTNGVWTAQSGIYSDAGNWAGSTVATGAGATADFSQVDLNGDISVTFNANRTLGHLIFGDTNLATGGTVELRSDMTPVPTITLAGASPTITVNALTPTAFDDVFVAPYLSGTSGFTKQGAGILTLGGIADSANFVGNNLSGVVDVAEGTLRIATGFSYYDFFNLVDPQAQTIDSINLQDGATLELQTGIGFNTVTAPAGANVTVRGAGGTFINNLTSTAGSGSTLNVIVSDTNAAVLGEQFSAHGNWSGFDTLNVSGISAPGEALSVFRLRPNGGSFDGASFAATVVNLDNVSTFVRTNSTGNTISIAELHGSATSDISGGSNPGGVARWAIGANNADSSHAGTITPGNGGLDLIKNGTGKLTLSGALSYSPVNTAAGGQAGNPDRRGGVTTINAGTLALSGAATLPAGTDDTGALGLLYSTVDVRPGATLDVSASPGYSTAALQQIIGGGTIVGNFNHDEGRLAPGDDNVGNSATLVRTAGTLTFANALTFNGGEILYDVAATPGAGNDLIQVNGLTNLAGGGVVTPNFLTGSVPTSGQYTILSSAGGFSGATTNWSVAWPGRSGSLPVSISGNNLVFNATVTDGDSIVWRGAASSNWDVQTTQNFFNNSTSSVDTFFNGDDVTFDDTATTFTVNLSQDVQPLNVVIDSTTDYTFTGAGKIVGFASLTKRGSSTLTLPVNNTYSGNTTLEGGTVDIGVNVGAFGSGQLTMSGATIRASNALTGGMTNSVLNVTAGTSNTIVANGEPTNTATNQLVLPNAAGSGDLTVTTEVEGRLVDMGGVNDQFTGHLTLAPSGAATTMGVRFFGGAGAGIPNGRLTVGAGVTVNQRQNSVSTVDVGELNGDAGAVLSGFAGGGTATEKTWRIGNLGTSSIFGGAITEGGTTTNLTKVGAGSLTITGAADNTYTGDTSVEGGTLSINAATLSDIGDVYLTDGTVFNLDFIGTDTIDSLFFGDVSQVTGTWGAIGSGAANQTSLITGTGLLDVTTFVPFVLAGDYNNDGLVNAADYTVWRDGGPLQNETASPGVVDAADYAAWSDNYGAVGPSSATALAVPEPTTILLAFGAIVFALSGRRN
ncbi:Autotransporter-associated beta strand repeat protein [Botrimarina colliarenosi]|uniref:Autotransporter-associated beta strand repeat protein n=1 Tax=Botrimarina colliarenosi TaxID=2528001 RepID=A0A5C5ZYC9_9BACT|nr:autotransporter-associated beta strand repeat-containing protein [Botrimarina colliarenosi]TWT92309.1 Autotransporter-associated beta strand repeat protein [Botrimarina colliarenosi]